MRRRRTKNGDPKMHERRVQAFDKGRREQRESERREERIWTKVNVSRWTRPRWVRRGRGREMLRSDQTSQNKANGQDRFGWNWRWHNGDEGMEKKKQTIQSTYGGKRQ